MGGEQKKVIGKKLYDFYKFFTEITLSLCQQIWNKQKLKIFTPKRLFRRNFFMVKLSFCQFLLHMFKKIYIFKHFVKNKN
jgi:hypothetical protein